jgi:opacity protein-like surface antigen
MKSLALVLLFCFTTVALSQSSMSVGVTGGLDIANLSVSNLPNGVTLSSKSGFVGGGVFEVGLSDVWFLQPELLYDMAGASETANSFIASETWKLSYVEVPILVKAKFMTTEMVKPYLFAGPDIGFTTTSEVDITPENIQGQGRTLTNDVKDSTESVNFAIDFGGGVEYALNSSTTLFGDIRYSLGLTDIDKTPSDAGTTTKTTGIKILVGVRFGI